MSSSEAHHPERVGFLGHVDSCARGLPPAYFALVMATGIVAIACQTLGMNSLSWILFAISAMAYPILWFLTIWRIVRFPKRIFKDFCDHSLAPGFFTIVAGTSILGSELFVIGHRSDLALIFWFATFFLALGITYPLFTGLIVQPVKPSIQKGLNGSWLIAVVAWQSISVLGGLLAPIVNSQRELLVFASLSTWMFGGMCYLWVIALIFYRYMFYTFQPQDLSPPYWINMGAVAISTLAGAGLVRNGTDSALLADLMPFLKGVTILFWVTATWWIPMLLFLGYWRHVYKHFPLSYSPLYWGAVFPLGMYTVCTYHLAEIVHVPALKSVAETFIYIALVAWLMTFSGMVRSFFGTRSSSG